MLQAVDSDGYVSPIRSVSLRLLPYATHSLSYPLRTYMAIRESSWFILAKATTGRVPVSGIHFSTVNQSLHL